MYEFNDRIIEVIKDKLALGLQEVGQEIANDAKTELTSMGGVDTGILRASITFDVNREKLSCTIGTNVEYAPYYHEGTGIYAAGGRGRQTPWRYRTADGKWHTTAGQKPKPFLQNAVDANRGKILAIIGRCWR